MKIILKEDVSGLLDADDVVEVVLFFDTAAITSFSTVKPVIATLGSRFSKASKTVSAPNKSPPKSRRRSILAASLKDVKLTIGAKTSATGTIFGSVNSIQIAEALEKLGFNIDRKIIEIEPVKEVGEYVATVKLHKDVTAQVPFEVVAE